MALVRRTGLGMATAPWHARRLHWAMCLPDERARRRTEDVYHVVGTPGVAAHPNGARAATMGVPLGGRVAARAAIRRLDSGARHAVEQRSRQAGDGDARGTPP